MKKTTDTITHRGALYRNAVFKSDAIDPEARTVRLAFSSEEPVSRWFGTEILDHSPGAVRLDRLRSNGPVLVDHDSRDHVGVVESVELDDDRKGRATVRFGQSARASEIFQDVVDGIRRNISVGYVIHEMVEKTKESVFRAIDWEPHELSFVSVPADVTVGVGRDSDLKQTIKIKRTITMETETETPPTPAPAPAPAVDPAEVKRQADQQASAVIQRQREEWTQIRGLGKEAGKPDLAEEAIERGDTLDQFRQALMDDLIANNKPVATTVPDPDVGAEARRYSLVRLFNYLANPNNARVRDAAKFELEVSADIANRSGASPQGAFVPGFAMSKRVLTAGTATDGAELVAEDLRAGDFIDVLRNSMVSGSAGARILDGLVGNVAIPRKTTASTGGWINPENAAAAESELQLDQVTLTPRTVGAWTDMSRQLLLQSTPSIDGLVQDDLSQALALAIDAAVFEGSGAAGQPTGIANAAGVATSTVAAAGSPTWIEFVEFETDVAVANAALGSLAYVTRPAVVGNLKTTEKATNTAVFIMDSSAPQDGNVSGVANGYRVMATNQVAANRIIFGNFRDVLIGMWGGLDVLVDPFTGGTAGTLRIVALQSADVGIRHGASFCINA